MPDAAARLEELRPEAEAAVRSAPSRAPPGGAGRRSPAPSADREGRRVRSRGRRSELTGVLRGIGDLPPEQRGPVGGAANAVRGAIESQLAERTRDLQAAELDERLARDRIDVTLPGDPPPASGRLHLITRTRREIEDVFLGLGFEVVEGPEVEFDYYNFTALNFPHDHPARAMQDTFYLGGAPLRRPPPSPLQGRTMETRPPPVYAIMPGRVY